MKKIICLFTIGIFFASSAAYAESTISELKSMRDKMFQVSVELKTVLTKTKEVILANTLWDASVMTVTQLDAYFIMVGIYETIPRESRLEQAAQYIIYWLTSVENTNDVNIKSLESMTNLTDPRLDKYVQTMKSFFQNINSLIRGEITKLKILKIAK
ncbi:hypothetical protein IID04_00145 [PVC group bacterium]|nr:hypothetical protein [PVC group bacterium]